MKNILLLALLPFTAGADQELDRCLRVAGGATSTVSSCLEQALQQEEHRLRKALNHTLTSLPPGRHGEMEQIQQLWEAYRNAKCRFLHHPQSGSGGLLDMQQCLLDETRRRIRELNGMP